MKKTVLALIALSLVLVGCGGGETSLYRWGEFPQQTYNYMSERSKVSPLEQIARLEKDIEKSKAENRAVPPGLYGHLGLLNLDVQNSQRAAMYFQLEKQVYPESTVLMNRLLQRMGATNSSGVKK
ncbi:DUF4810 domain-containing protein [Acinetobacter faecalis]|uniref:DUF4810 domain-containing protein n=1 Tax=Acinetobacter faecalis TaxID=2665161 RepID=UPI002A9115F8|nr:DUF4810 domain-containing protein [Acinetobacter faecalis]MDY6481025.1 DUF4810 domain-containing protein [Acinetobacter faecalis]